MLFYLGVVVDVVRCRRRLRELLPSICVVSSVYEQLRSNSHEKRQTKKPFENIPGFSKFENPKLTNMQQTSNTCLYSTPISHLKIALLLSEYCEGGFRRTACFHSACFNPQLFFRFGRYLCFSSDQNGFVLLL